MKFFHHSIAAAFAMGLAALGLAQAPPSYTVTSLGTLGGYNSVATGLNNVGQATGNSNASSGYVRAFLYGNGSMQDLGTLGGAAAYGMGLNNLGDVVGMSWLADGTTEAPFLYSNGVLTDLSSKIGSQNRPVGINDAGQITGEDTSQAFIYSNGVLTEFSSLGVFDNTTSSGINQLGQVTGTGWLQGKPDAYLYTNGGLVNLDTLGGNGSEGWGLNASGEVAGNVTLADNSSRGFLYSNGQMRALATLGGTSGGALGINDAGEMVGESSRGDGTVTACLYWNGTPYDLNALISGSTPFPLQYASYINNQGVILAADTESKWYVLTPVSAPEPAPIAVLLSGVSTLFLSRRRRGAAN